MKERIIEAANQIGKRITEISDFIHGHPELGNQEFQAAEKLTNFLKSHGFEVKMGLEERPTAFKAVLDSGKTGPSVAYLCEYDALPEIGHGCGHNMIGAMSVGAAAILAEFLPEIGGKIVVFGTPAEETDGAKVELAEKGYFEGIDAAMILHPEGNTEESGNSLAMDALQFSFKGRASHAAASPEAGINALDAAILTFNGINALRQHVSSDVRMHGIITEGGKAANIVPEYAEARFYVRAAKREVLDLVAEKVKNIARGAALMTGAELEISYYEISYDDMKTNKVLSRAFNENLKKIGIEEIHSPKPSMGSIDMGNVSQVVPAIHPYIGVAGKEMIGHTKDFAQAVITEKAHEALKQGATALALTGYDVLTDAKLLKEIKKEFA
ncbi:MAG TPA: amidohydrolase [Cyanobacteria bacterium UBA8530]|nr:amidohydrolase [Cyanobacteria bacterium UBA8530]